MAKKDTRYTKYYYARERAKRLVLEIAAWDTVHQKLKTISDNLGMKSNYDGVLPALAKECKALGEWMNEINAAADGLSERDKYVFELRYLDGRSWKEIGLLTRLSEQRIYEINVKVVEHFRNKGKLNLLLDGTE